MMPSKLVVLFFIIPFITTFLAYYAYQSMGKLDRDTRRYRNAVLALCTTVLSSWFLLFVLELGFRAFVVQSDGFSHTLAARRWLEKYWGPTNSFGFRDKEFSPHELASAKRLFVVGDSFVAGRGIENPEDRFSNHLRRWMGTSWCVVNFAHPGWDTRNEINMLRTFAIQPDVVVWSYYLNDIAGAAAEHGHTRYVDLSISSRWVRTLVDNSYFVNFFYWRWFRLVGRLEVGAYWDAIQADFDNEAIWSTHQKDLHGVVDYMRDRHIALLIVIFPILTDVSGSHRLTAKVADIFRQSGVPVIDLSDYLIGRDPRDLIVNNVDAHPNVGLHLEAAKIIYRHLKKLGYSGDRTQSEPPTCHSDHIAG